MRAWLIVFLCAAVTANHVGYSGWKSYFIKPTTEENFREMVRVLQEFNIDVLSHPIIDREGVVLVRPDQMDFLQALEATGVEYKVHTNDVQAALEIDNMKIEAQKKESMARNGGRLLPYDNYHDLDVIDDYLEEIAARYPDIATLVIPANSFEGRPIRYLRISTTNFADPSKPVIIIDGGIHAREWISPPTVTWAIHKLTEDVTENDLLENYDWILLPVVNPDGYTYTHTTTNNRFWRMTRSTDQHALSNLCPGVDGNRNYDFFWNTVGTSSNPCLAETYAGNQPFSEIETRVVRDIILEHLDRTALYLTMHSYGSMILYPWGHDGSLSSNALNLHTVGIAMADAIHQTSLSNFPRYVVGNSVLVVGYPAAGASEDYAHVVGVPLSYTYELPGLAWGFQGFHLDPIYIEHVCKETWDGIAAGVRRGGAMWRASRQ